MPYLEIFRGGRKLQEVPVEGVQVVVGRGSDADLRLEAVAVSRRHARIRVEDGAWVVEDLGTRNGTYVNGSREFKCVLHDGDRVQLDDYVLVFRRPAGEIAPRGVNAQASAEAVAMADAFARGVRWEPLSGDDDDDAFEQHERTNVLDTLEGVRKRREAQLRLGPHLVEQGDEPKVHPLERETTVIGGHRRACDVRVASAGWLGSAALERLGDGSFAVRWTGLLGCVRVNGQRRRRATLVGGEELEVLGAIFTFHAGG